MKYNFQGAQTQILLLLEVFLFFLKTVTLNVSLRDSQLIIIVSLVAYTPVLVSNGKQYYIVLTNHYCFLFLSLSHHISLFFQMSSKGLYHFIVHSTTNQSWIYFFWRQNFIKYIILNKYCHKMNFLLMYFITFQGLCTFHIQFDNHLKIK